LWLGWQHDLVLVFGRLKDLIFITLSEKMEPVKNQAVDVCLMQSRFIQAVALLFLMPLLLAGPGCPIGCAQLGLTDSEQAGIAAAPSPELPQPPPIAPPPVPKHVKNSSSVLVNPYFKTVAPGVLQLGRVRVDKTRRAVSFPARLNMAYTNALLMEYILVTDYGKTHESILKTDAQPYHIYQAMLQLKDKGTAAGTPQVIPETKARSPGKITGSGQRVDIEVSWMGDNGREMRRSAGDFVCRQDTKKALPKDGWIYGGSSVWKGRLQAQQEGQVISLGADSISLFNFNSAGPNNEHVWFANNKNLPPANVPLQVSITLFEPETTTTAKKKTK
jgi:hypothetical protein